MQGGEHAQAGVEYRPVLRLVQPWGLLRGACAVAHNKVSGWQ
jgi:hypothetical protein